jgi:hypothetical protein
MLLGRLVLVASAAALLGIAALTGARSARAADAAQWTPLGRGVEHRALAQGAIAGHAFRFRPADVELRVVPAPEGRGRVEELAPAGDAITTNASFFDEAGKTMGLAVDRGRSLGGRRLTRWAGFLVERGRPRIVPGSALGDGAGAEVVVQGLPRLVVAGALPRLKPQRALRTVVCVAEPNVVLLVTTSRVEAADLARLLAAPPADGGFGCRDALNLDGGGSTQLRARWGAFEARVEGAWGVPNALVVLPKPAPGR